MHNYRLHTSQFWQNEAKMVNVFKGSSEASNSSPRTMEIVFGREGRLGTRTIRITAIGEDPLHNIVSTVSRVSDNGHGMGLNHPPPGVEQAL
jgi:hypothetical protein